MITKTLKDVNTTYSQRIDEVSECIEQGTAASCQGCGPLKHNALPVRRDFHVAV